MHRLVVIIDLPGECFAVELDDTEVMLAVRVVVLGECVEPGYRIEYSQNTFRTPRIYTMRHHRAAKPIVNIPRKPSELVIEFASQLPDLHLED